MIRKMKSIVSMLTVAVVFAACSKQDLKAPIEGSDGQTNGSAKNAKVSSSVAIDWMNAFREAVKNEGKNPPQASRIYAYAGIGLYEAVVPGMSNYKSLAGQIDGLQSVPKPSMGQIDMRLTANEALYEISSYIFGTLKPADKRLFDSLHNAYLSNIASTPATLSNSVDYGKLVAAAVLNRAANDNFATTRLLTYMVPSGDPSYWVPTGAVATPLEPFWGGLKCFAMANGAACTVKSQIPFNTNPGSDFYNQALEVATVKNSLTQDQKDIALWWADGAGATPTPPGHWVGIAAQLADDKDLELGQAADMFAEVNIAMADAFISCWNEKYSKNLLRPVTYIRQYISGQSTWTSFIATPPFPEYPSGHSVASGAAADVLTRLFGNVSFTDQSNVNLGLAPRSYGSFYEAAGEAAISRLYGGIHYREAIQNGLAQGKEVSKALSTGLTFRK